MDGSIYIFGGRGSDNRSRGSMHVLDCSSMSLYQLKTLNAPDARDGHSCVYHDGKLMVFGGCEGGESDMTLFNRVHVLDLLTKEWLEYRTNGVAPCGRDGHAAALIDGVMVIYGGGIGTYVSGDVYGLNLLSGMWIEYRVEGDPPGPRESMSCATLGNSMYIFGGNINPDQSGSDIYSSDLYRLDIRQRTVESVRLRPFTGSPPARLSCSMSAVSPSMLVIFGGECSSGMLQDIWVHHLNLNVWRELRPRSNIEGRIAHIGAAYNGKLVIFGGLDKNSTARNEIAVLVFTTEARVHREPGFEPVRTVKLPKNTLCRRCLHYSEACKNERLSEFVYPQFHNFSRLFWQTDIMEELEDLEGDWTINFLHFLHVLLSTGASSIHISAVLPADDPSKRSKPMSQDSISQLIIVCNKAFDPKPLSDLLFSHTNTEKLLRVLSTPAVLLSKTENFTTCCLLLEDQAAGLYRCAAVFDKQGALITPDADSPAATRLREEVSPTDLQVCSGNLRVLLRPKGLRLRSFDILVPSATGPISLCEVLKSLFFKPSEVKVYLNENAVTPDYAKFTKYQKKDKTAKYIARSVDMGEGWPWDLRLYHSNSLVYYKRKDDDRKRRRGAMKPLDVQVLSEDIVDCRTKVTATQSLVRSCELLDLFPAEWEEEDTPRRQRRPPAFLKDY